MRLATVDVGTNTALLLIADVEPGAPLRAVYQEQQFVRLGKGVDEYRRISPEAMERLRRVLVDYRRKADQHAAERIVVVGTSASRDANNRDELQAFVKAETGLDFEVLTGEEEAEWSFMGAVSEFPDLGGRCMVLDIGGGSTELIAGVQHNGNSRIEYRCSIDVGTVRVTERFAPSQPAEPEQVEAARAFVHHMVQAMEVPEGNLPLIGAAGTASSLGLVHTGSGSWDQVSDQKVRLSFEEVIGWEKKLLAMRYEDVLALNPDALRGRADVFPMGLVILHTVMGHLGTHDVLISSRGLRHGLALREQSTSNRYGTIQ